MLHVVALCVGSGALVVARAQSAVPAGSAQSAAEANIHAAAATVADPDNAPTVADVNATELCRNVHFVAYSALNPDGAKFEESVSWDDRSESYLVRGPSLGMIFDYPGVSNIPSDDSVPGKLFRIAVRAQLSRPINRFCQDAFQESAHCDAHGDIIYTQLYTDCDLQRLQHVVMLTPDQAGAVPLLAVRVQDVRGVYSNPYYLWGGSDLRLR
jgi:hypothetical protein